jgi:hypothetical protein
VAKDKGPDQQSAAELLGEWRAAERDTAAAQAAKAIAEQALAAAHAAEEAAKETETAALAALDASKSAQTAAASAKQAATLAAEAASVLTAVVEGDKARANHAVDDAEAAEGQARERFHDAERKGFSREKT